MKRLLLILGGLLTVLVGTGVGLYLFGTGVLLDLVGSGSAPGVQAIHLRWGTVTTETTEIKADVRIDNRVGLGISLGEVELPIDFYDVRAVSLVAPALKLGSGESVLRVDGVFYQNNLLQWWPQFVNNDEVLRVHLRPIVRVKVLGRSAEVKIPVRVGEISVPLLKNMHSVGPQTIGFDGAPLIEVARAPKEHFVVGPPGPERPILTLESWELHWGEVTRESTQVLGTATVRNETSVPIPIQGLRLAIIMNGLEVLPDLMITPDYPILPPGQSVPLRLSARLENAKLVKWWTSHLQQNETTKVTVRVGVTVVLPPILPGMPSTLELPLLLIPGVSCQVQTNIMGMANYQVAKAIGKETGTEPTPASVSCLPPLKPMLAEGLTPPAILGTPSVPASPLPTVVVPVPTPTIPTAVPTPPLTPPASPTPIPILPPFVPPVLQPSPTPTPTSSLRPTATPTPSPTPTATPTALAILTPTPTATSTPAPTQTAVMYTLNTATDPAGSGTVKLDPSSSIYSPGSSVRLTALPNPGYAFERWGGDISRTSPTENLVMDSHKSIIAYFRRILP